MNKNRRKQLEELCNEMTNQLEGLRALLDEEQEYYDNMPESLQSSERGDQSQEYISTMESALDDIESALGTLEEVYAS